MNDKKKPVHEIRIHAIKAAVWQNTIGEATRYNVTFSRVYKDGEEWRSTDSFGRDDLLPVSKAADLAHTWICQQRSSR